MNKTQLLAILFFSGIWGLSEAVLGDALYSSGVPLPSVYLAVIAFFVLAVAAPFVPRPGGATAIGLLAMLYKFLNVPFFGCHLAGIALLGVSWDLVFGLAARVRPARGWRRSSVLALVSCLLGHLLFVLAMLLVFRTEYWIAKGWAGGLRHVILAGGLASLGSALVVPLGFRLAERLRGGVAIPSPPGLRPRLIGVLTALVTAGVWSYGVLTRVLRG